MQAVIKKWYFGNFLERSRKAMYCWYRPQKVITPFQSFFLFWIPTRGGWSRKWQFSFTLCNENGLTTPHCWDHQVQKVDTEAKFYVILFVMINALIWCNFEKNQLGFFWDNPIYPIRYPHGQDLGFCWKVEKLQFL